MAVRTVRVRLIEKTVCDELLLAAFERPEEYRFRAGQWLRLTLDTERGRQTKTFSIASAPSDGSLDMATRLSGSAFKNALAETTAGDEVEISMPGGRFSLPDDPAVVFLVGGVGITPVRSMLRDAMTRGRSLVDAVLIFGNREPECAPYLEELDAMGRVGLDVVPVYEQAPSGWTGERGFIDAALVRRHVDEVVGRPFVTAGPPEMVRAMETVLDDLGVPEQSRFVERFGPLPASAPERASPNEPG